MRYLLDTCTALWLSAFPERLSARARRTVLEPGAEVLLSAVSVWEIVLKQRAGKLEIAQGPDRFVAELHETLGLRALPMTEAAALATTRLPDLHQDPFDRLLIAQAVENGLVLVTPDENIQRYPVRTLW